MIKSLMFIMFNMGLSPLSLFLEITNLISDMHTCADHILELFSIRAGEAPDQSLMANPDKLCTAIKQALREAAVGK